MTNVRRARFAVVLSLGLCLAAGLALGASGSERVRLSRHAGRVKVLLGSKAKTYHAATAAKPAGFLVTGPAQVRVLSRYLYPSREAAVPVEYALRIEMDGLVVRTAEERAGVSSTARQSDGVKIGTLEETRIKVPAGKHRLRVAPIDPDARVALRVFKGEARKTKLKWIPLAPESYVRAVRLHVGERETTCYQFNEAHPVTTTIIGPLRVRVSSRIDFGPTTGPTQTYVIKTFLDGTSWKGYTLKSRPSHTSTYPDLPEITPGVGQSVILDVPSGTHTVTIGLGATTARGAALQLYAPKSELRRGIQ